MTPRGRHGRGAAAGWTGPKPAPVPDPSRTQADVDAVYVTDYYRLEPIDARTAYFVVGSDVYGPMGRELIPFARANDAREFMKDHRGKVILRFSDVTLEVLKGLD